MDPTSIGAVLGWVVLHAAAMATAWGTRVAASPRVERAVQIGFFAAMAAVASAAWLCHQREFGLWLPSAVTLVAMVLTAVVDFSRLDEPAAWSSRLAGR